MYAFAIHSVLVCGCVGGGQRLFADRLRAMRCAILYLATNSQPRTGTYTRRSRVLAEEVIRAADLLALGELRICDVSRDLGAIGRRSCCASSRRSASPALPSFASLASIGLTVPAQRVSDGQHVLIT